MSDEPYQDAARPHEARDASIPVIRTTAAAVALLVLVGLFGSWLFWRHRPAVRRDGPTQSFHYGPRDIPDAASAWPAIERETQLHLHTYGWVDRKAGIVRIPIDQAMKRMVRP